MQQRRFLGILSIVCFLLGMGIWWAAPGGHYEELRDMTWRAGVLFSVWWLAYPERQPLAPLGPGRPADARPRGVDLAEAGLVGDSSDPHVGRLAAARSPAGDR